LLFEPLNIQVHPSQISKWPFVIAARNLTLWQVDFVSVFLNSDSAYKVYMEQPKGFEEGGLDYVWKLKKTLYGTMPGGPQPGREPKQDV